MPAPEECVQAEMRQVFIKGTKKKENKMVSFSLSKYIQFVWLTLFWEPILPVRGKEGVFISFC